MHGRDSFRNVCFAVEKSWRKTEKNLKLSTASISTRLVGRLVGRVELNLDCMHQRQQQQITQYRNDGRVKRGSR
jgi:hypothetical protein